MKVIKHVCLILLLAAVMMLPGDVANAAQRVTLCKGESVVGQYDDIMSAFAAMDDVSGDYVIELTNDGTAYNIQKDYTWPEVNSIYISGGRSVLYIEGAQVFQSDITLDSIFIYQADFETGFCIDMQDYTITFHGKVIMGQEGLHTDENGAQIAYSNVNLVGTEGSMLEIETNQSVELYCGTVAEKIVVTEGKVMFRGTNKDYQIADVEVYDGSIQLASVMLNGANPGTVNVNIDRFVNCGHVSNLYIWMENNSILNIGEVDSVNIKDFSLFFAQDGYMNNIENMDITIENVTSNVSALFFQLTAYVWSQEETVYDVITVDKLVTVSNFSGIVHGRYAVNYYVDGENMGYESGTFQTVQKGNDYYMDYDSFDTTYLERSYVCGDFIYQITEENTARITAYKGTAEILEIPTELDGYEVTCLSELGNVSKNVKEIVLPATVREVGEYAFLNVSALETITVAKDNQYFKSIDGVLYSADETILYRCPHTRDSIMISEATTTIHSYAFTRCKNLTSIVIPDTITAIGFNAFQDCTALESAKLSKSVTSVYAYVFAGCTNLKEVILPTEYDCNIYYNAFQWCRNLKRIYIPENITKVDVDAFDTCENLDEIVFLGSNTSFDGISKELFNSCAYDLKVYCPTGSATQTNLEAYDWQSYSLEELETYRIHSEEISLELGDVYQAHVYRNPYDDVYNTSITWKSSNTAVATIDKNGLITTVAAGEAVISATCNGKILTMQVEVSFLPVTNITLNYSSASIDMGCELKLVAQVTPTTATNKTIIWSSSDESIATVDQTGKVTAHRHGNVVISATAADGSGVTATCELEVFPIFVGEITLSERQLIIGVGEEYVLIAQVTPEDATIKDLKWYSEDPSIVSVDENGKLTAHAPGGVLIYAEATDGGGCSAACWVISKYINVEDIFLDKTSHTMAVGEQITLTEAISPINASNKDVTWSSSNAKVATVDENGVVTARGIGTATITVTTDDGEKTATCVIIVDRTMPLQILEQPESQKVMMDDYTVFEVEATGVDLSYQWQFTKDGKYWSNSSMTGYNTASMTVQGLASRDGYQYRCVITDASGNQLISEPATLMVNTLTIVKQPESQTINVNEYITFDVQVNGTNLKYQWQFTKDGKYWSNSSMTGSNTASMTVQGLASRDGYQYRCVIMDASGNQITTEPATLEINTLIIGEQPEDKHVSVNEYTIFSVDAEGNDLKYQWQFTKDGKYWSNSGMSGANTASMTVQALASRDGYQYRCVITDVNGNQVISDTATLTVNMLVITKQPECQVAVRNAYVTFVVEVDGEGLSYQWQCCKDGVYWFDSSMAGSNTASLKVQALASRDGYQYRCVITDAKGNRIVSDAVALTVDTLAIVTQPEKQNTIPNAYVTFWVEVEGEGLSYQWQCCKDGVYWFDSSMAGANTASLKVQALVSRDGYQYRCIVTDANGNQVISDAASLTIGGIMITKQPASQIVSENAYVTYAVAVEGEGLSYQWQCCKDGVYWFNSSMTGANTASLTVQGIASRDGYQYRCVITDKDGNQVISEAAELMVK